jgi:tetratricopeptide (TPR) repeat protein
MQVLASRSSDDHAAGPSSELSNDIGFTYFSDRQLKEAEEWFKKAIQYSGNHGRLPYMNLASLYTTEERYRDALDVLQKCSDMFGDDESTTMARSFVYFHLGEYDRAISDLESSGGRETRLCQGAEGPR